MTSNVSATTTQTLSEVDTHQDVNDRPLWQPCAKGDLIIWRYLLLVLITFITALTLILFFRGMNHIFNLINKYSFSRKMRSQKLGGLTSGSPSTSSGGGEILNMSEISTLYDKCQMWTGNLIRGNSVVGRVFVTINFLCSMIASALYIYDTYEMPEMEMCLTGPWYGLTTLRIEIAMSFIFIISLFFRFISFEDKVRFLFTRQSFVDFLTILHPFYAAYMKRSMLGVRFVRMWIFIDLTDVLIYIRVISSPITIRLVLLSSIVVVLILASSGMVFFLENSGDAWHDYLNKNTLSYGTCIYYMVVTVSTVGYGDISTVTDSGRAFIVLYIFGALALFTNFLPEIVSIVRSRSIFDGKYMNDGRKFVIVCGNITHETVEIFIDNIFHSFCRQKELDIVLIAKHEPDDELLLLLKRENSRVLFFKGSSMSPKDLRRVQVDRASACLIFANRFCEEPDYEDTMNIVRVMSFKNYCPNIRIIIQLLVYKNKKFLRNIQGWDEAMNDQAICMNELKLGILGTSCLTPGFSTLISNLINSPVRSDASHVPSKFKRVQYFDNIWRKEYEGSSRKTILSEKLSSYFDGMKLYQVAIICYERLDLVMLAAEHNDPLSQEFVMKSFVHWNDDVPSNTTGIFFASPEKDLSVISTYYESVYKEVNNDMCLTTVGASNNESANNNDTNIVGHDDEILFNANLDRRCRSGSSTVGGGRRMSSTFKFSRPNCKSRYIRARRIEDCIIVRDKHGGGQENKIRKANNAPAQLFAQPFRDHVIIVLFADISSPMMGLHNLINPLRKSFSHLMCDVIIIGNIEYIRKNEWQNLSRIPMVKFFDGNPLNRDHLEYIGITKCKKCVIVSAKRCSLEVEKVLIDIEVLLAFLDIKNIPVIHRKDDNSYNELTFLEESGGDQTSDVAQETQEDETTFDTQLIEGNNNNAVSNDKKQISFCPSVKGCASSPSLLSPIPPEYKISQYPTSNKESDQYVDDGKIPILMFLTFISNASFLDDTGTGFDDKTEAYSTMPYAAGQIFSLNHLNSLMTMTYYTPPALRLVRKLCTSRKNNDFYERNVSTDKKAVNDAESLKVHCLSMESGQSTISHLLDNQTKTSKPLRFEELFKYALQNHHFLVLGLYRLKSVIVEMDSGCNTRSNSDIEFEEDEFDDVRIVLTLPNKQTTIHRSDIVFALK